VINRANDHACYIYKPVHCYEITKFERVPVDQGCFLNPQHIIRITIKGGLKFDFGAVFERGKITEYEPGDYMVFDHKLTEYSTTTNNRHAYFIRKNDITRSGYGSYFYPNPLTKKEVTAGDVKPLATGTEDETERS
jgi:hypothetical protein